jgi:transcriptional regulator
MVRPPNLDLLQGTLDLLILKTLSWGPRHGYAIARWIADRTGDELVIEDGALYTGLHRLQKQGWLRSEWGRSENNRAAKYYELTPAGQKQLQVRVSVWERYSAAVSRVVRTA